MHFRGLEAGIVSPVSGYTQMVFGVVNSTDTVTDPDTLCETMYLGEEELMLS